MWCDFDYDRLLNGLKKGARECDCKLVLLKDSGDERLDGIILSRLNALWMNPQKDGAVFADSPPWINHGGERFWPIPALAFAATFESGRLAAEFKPYQILPGAKIGFFADKAVAVYPDCLFVQKTMLQPQFCYPECSNVQLYGNPVGNFGKYLEIEILGESTELLSSWELLDRK